MPDGTIVISAELDDKAAQAQLSKLSKDIDKAKAKLNTKETEQNAIEAQLKKASDEADKTKASLESLKKEAKEVNQILSGEKTASPEATMAAYSRRDEISAAIKQQENLFQGQIKQADRLGAQYSKISEEVEAARGNLTQMSERAGELSAQLSGAKEATIGTSKAAEAADVVFQKIGNRVKLLARRVILFAVITRGLRAIRDYFGSALSASSEFTKALASLRGALLTLAQPIYNVVVPALTTLINVLTRVVNAASRIISAIFGTTAEASAEAAKSLYDQANALGGVGSASKKAGKNLASFDEINKLSGDSALGGAGGTAPDFASAVKDNLSAVMELFVGTGLVALGAILAFTGVNIPLGVGLMAIGALSMYDAVSMNWDAIKEELRGSLGGVTATVSTSLLAIGAALAFSGVAIPIGLGLMAAGAVGFAATVAANWDRIPDLLRGSLGKTVAILSGMLLAIGAVLAFSGASIGLGIGLMLIGAVGLGSVISANWNAIPELMRGSLGKATAIISTFLLAIGVLLVFTGAGIPLGLGLIGAGVIGLVTAIVPNWNFIVDKLNEILNSVTNWWNNSVLGALKRAKDAVFDWAESVFNKIKEALGFAKSGAAEANDYANAAVAAARMAANAANSVAASAANAAANAGRLATATGTQKPNISVSKPPKSFDTKKLKKLATGAVIPPNREFLAVLGDQKSGTNIETPLATMVQAFRQALADGGYSGGSEAVLVLDKEVLGKVIYKLNKAEGNRIGVNLAGV